MKTKPRITSSLQIIIDTVKQYNTINNPFTTTWALSALCSLDRVVPGWSAHCGKRFGSQKSRMIGLPSAERITICSAVLIQHRIVTDEQKISCGSIIRALQSIARLKCRTLSISVSKKANDGSINGLLGNVAKFV